MDDETDEAISGQDLATAISALGVAAFHLWHDLSWETQKQILRVLDWDEGIRAILDDHAGGTRRTPAVKRRYDEDQAYLLVRQAEIRKGL